MQDLSNINTIKEILSAHGFTFSKSLGQNFLINPTVCPRMAEACGADENTGVIEIGAGIGVLTAELAKRAKKVVSLELDTRLIPVLAGTLEDFDNVEVLNADVLKTDLHELIASRFNGMRVVVCAKKNLTGKRSPCVRTCRITSRRRLSCTCSRASFR